MNCATHVRIEIHVTFPGDLDSSVHFYLYLPINVSETKNSKICAVITNIYFPKELIIITQNFKL